MKRKNSSGAEDKASVKRRDIIGEMHTLAQRLNTINSLAAHELANNNAEITKLQVRNAELSVMCDTNEEIIRLIEKNMLRKYSV